MKRRRRLEGLLALGRAGCSSVVFGSTNRSRECGGATIVIAAVGRSSAPVEAAPAPAVVVSKEEEDLVARARALRGASQLARTESK